MSTILRPPGPDRLLSYWIRRRARLRDGKSLEVPTSPRRAPPWPEGKGRRRSKLCKLSEKCVEGDVKKLSESFDRGRGFQDCLKIVAIYQVSGIVRPLPTLHLSFSGIEGSGALCQTKTMQCRHGCFPSWY